MSQFVTILLQVPATSIESGLADVLKELSQKFSTFMGLGQAIGGLGALAYIFFRVWGHLARGEEIDIYPLFRPVALAFCLLFYSQITGSILTFSTILDTGTKTIATSQSSTITSLIASKKSALDSKQAQIVLNPRYYGRRGDNVFGQISGGYSRGGSRQHDGQRGQFRHFVLHRSGYGLGG